LDHAAVREWANAQLGEGVTWFNGRIDPAETWYWVANPAAPRARHDVPERAAMFRLAGPVGDGRRQPGGRPQSRRRVEHLDAVGGLGDVADLQRGQLGAAAHHRQPEHTCVPIERVFRPAVHPDSDDNGRPSGARDIRPPLNVWIDVPELLRAPAGHRAHTQPGIVVGFRAQGVLLQWGPASTGAWLALVRYTPGEHRRAGCITSSRLREPALAAQHPAWSFMAGVKFVLPA